MNNSHAPNIGQQRGLHTADISNASAHFAAMTTREDGYDAILAGIQQEIPQQSCHFLQQA